MSANPDTADHGFQLSEGVLAALFAGRRARVVAVLDGAINRLFRVAFDGPDATGDVVVRVRVNDHLFLYEQGIVKEAWLSHALAGLPVPPPAAGTPPHVPPLPRVLHYDTRGTLVPWPLSVSPWRDGVALADRPEPAAYRRLGAVLARLHMRSFPAFFARVTDLPDGGTQDWAALWRAGLARAALVDDQITRRLAALADPDTRAARPVLVHNDLHARNILLCAEGEVALLDWDNAVIDVAEIDFVKLAWWTTVDGDGTLAPAPALYQATLEGYLQAGGRPPDPGLLRAATVLWLVRVLGFQARRGGAPPGFPGAETYRPQLIALLDTMLSGADA